MKKNKSKELDELKNKIVPVLKKNKIKKAGIFGSYARGEAGKKSDVDILIQARSGMTLFDLAGIKQELEQKLGKNVDIVDYGTVHPLLKSGIMKEQVKII